MTTYGVASSVFGPTCTVEAAIELLKETGFDRIELSAEPGHLQDWPSDPASLRSRLEAAGIVPWSLHSPSAGWHNGAADRDRRNASITLTADSFRLARQAGVDLVICHSNAGDGAYTDETFFANQSRSRIALTVLAKRAAEAGVRIAIENLPARGLPRPGVRVEQLLEMIDGLGEHVGLCLDAGHANANGLVAADEARAAGEKLFALHLQDNDGLGEDQHLMPTTGTTDWAAFRAALAEIGFAGPRTFEVGPGEAGSRVTLGALAALRDEWLAEST